jgi:hypothetical protein
MGGAGWLDEMNPNGVSQRVRLRLIELTAYLTKPRIALAERPLGSSEWF